MTYVEAAEAWRGVHDGMQRMGMESDAIETLADYFDTDGRLSPDEQRMLLTAKFGPILKAAFPDEHSITRFQVAETLAGIATGASQ